MVNPHCQAVDGVGIAIDEWREGLAGKDGLVIVSGSLYTVGEAISIWRADHGP